MAMVVSSWCFLVLLVNWNSLRLGLASKSPIARNPESTSFVTLQHQHWTDASTA